MEKINTFQEAVEEIGEEVDPFDLLKWLSNNSYLTAPYRTVKNIMELLIDDEWDEVAERYPEVEVDEEFIWNTVDDFVIGHPYEKMVKLFK